MAETTPSISTKRPRAETESAGSDAPVASAAPSSARAVRPPTKRPKPQVSPPCESEDDPEEPLPDHDSDTETPSDDEEGGLASLAKRTKQPVGSAGSSGSLKASGKRARFLVWWAKHTPEQTLSSSTLEFFICARALLTTSCTPEALVGIWWASCYDHFQKPKLLRVTKPDGTVAYMHRFVCKR